MSGRNLNAFEASENYSLSQLNYSVKCKENGCLGSPSATRSLKLVPSSLSYSPVLDSYGNTQAIEYIKSKEKLSGSASQKFSAGNYIELNNGFEATNSNVFSAEIKTCIDE